ncbi:hypothetical protein TcWFU_000801 [Taenia crassiceps]|uniref:Uncharacterized protein n=1 Tax=Taenia crassiceps TaxID=6207 RepID=A0ABR4QNT1_9CEST
MPSVPNSGCALSQKPLTGARTTPGLPWLALVCSNDSAVVATCICSPLVLRAVWCASIRQYGLRFRLTATPQLNLDSIGYSAVNLRMPCSNFACEAIYSPSPKEYRCSFFEMLHD